MPAVAVGVDVSMCMVIGFCCSREMQLIILWLYYPGFSTTPVPDCSVTCGEYNQAQVTSTVNRMAMCFLLRVFVTVLFVRDWISTHVCAVFPPPCSAFPACLCSAVSVYGPPENSSLDQATRPAYTHVSLLNICLDCFSASGFCILGPHKNLIPYS